MAHRGWGESCVIGVAAAGKEISTRPFQLVYITHKYDGLDNVNAAIDALHGGSCLRAVVHIADSGIQPVKRTQALHPDRPGNG